jgi:nitrate/nitrite transporter NarK
MIGILGGLVFPAMMGTLRDLTGSYQVGLGVLAATMLASAGVVLVIRSLARRRALEARAYVHP